MLDELRRVTPQATLAAFPEEAAKRELLCEGEPLATWWIQQTPGTTYWRCHVPAKHLPGQALALRYSDLKIGPDGEVYVPRQRGVAVWQFLGNATRALIAAHLQEQGVRCLMEIDDNYLVPPPHGSAPGWSHKLDRSEKDNYSRQAHRKIVRWLDGMIVSTPYLATTYEPHTQVPIYVCPNSIDLEDWPPVDPSFEGRAIGYAGSWSHRFDIDLIARGLSDVASRVEIYRLGVQGKLWTFPYTQMPWTDDLAEYRTNLQVLDVGLCPLKRNEWADCKSDIKAMEYLLAGAVPIVQKAPPYSDWIDVVPSAATEKEWRRQIRWAADAPADELRDAWQRGMDFLLANKLIDQHIDKWREAIA